MKRNFHFKRVLLSALVVSSILPLPVLPAALTLSQVPLANSTTTSVLPNLMFVLDNSGSMGFDYLPDWIGTDNTADRMMNGCLDVNGLYTQVCTDDGVSTYVYQPLSQSPDVNGVYYNPSITYLLPYNSDGTNKASQGTPWTASTTDGFGVQTKAFNSSTASTTFDLTTKFPDLEWCTDTNYTDCLRNDNYLLPGTVNNKSYRTSHPTTSNGATGTVVSGTRAAPTTSSRKWGPHYYLLDVMEYCDALDLKNCQSAKTATFQYPAKFRWCSDVGLTNCQATRVKYIYDTPRFPGKIVPPSITFTINGTKSVSRVNNIKINGSEILSAAVNSSNSNITTADLAKDVVTNINACNLAKTGNCGIAGYAASYAVDPADANIYTVTIWAPLSLSVVVGNALYKPVLTTVNGTKSFSWPASPNDLFKSGVTVSGGTKRVDIVSGQTYTAAATRTDCAAAACTYAEEMTNFANWFTYYRTRMQMMKTSVSRAFKKIDNRYRVGFITISSQTSYYLPIDTFNNGSSGTSQKEKWYSKLTSINPNNGTPLRSALSLVGRIYAGKKPLNGVNSFSDTYDPVQYSCQQNFTLLTTDGFWNTDADSDVKGVNGAQIGNMDGGSTPRPQYEGPTASTNSLADTAKYYYDTDLRDKTLWNNCTGALGFDVCENNVFLTSSDSNAKQHMTTFTLGLGVDGTMLYDSRYKESSYPGQDKTEYYRLKTGTAPTTNWSVPVADTETAVDDLWHAAVNGNGTYFSAKNPTQLATSLTTALNEIDAKNGAGAAAASSSLNPVNQNNFQYVASYTTSKWQGNLEARVVDLDTGEISKSATWAVEDVLADSCKSPSTIESSNEGGSTVYNCVTTNSNAASCSDGTLDANNTCSTPMAVGKTGTMRALVSTDSDKRKILMKDSGGTTLVDFTYGNLTTTQQSYFAGTSLSQWSDWSAAQKTAAAGANLVNYIRGQTGYEDRTGNAMPLYRTRQATLGDAVHAQPVFVGRSVYSYTDAGYSSFVSDTSNRQKTVFLGTNDGMLHAFNADTGVEMWAYVPSMVMPNLWKLADKNYATMHNYFVDGPVYVGDVYDSAAKKWKTILVGGLGGGGRGYYALDVTDPAQPKFLWELNENSDVDIGYGYQRPHIAKMKDGTWVVMFGSNYNNISPGTGRGFLFVRDAITGKSIRKIDTSAGDSTTPIGLAPIVPWADNPGVNNLALYVYGGDLQGNVWRFDMDANTVMKFAILKDPTGVVQPITSQPELGAPKGGNKRMIYVGTGKYIEVGDLTSTQVQSVYGIMDEDETKTLDNPRTVLVKQTLKNSADNTTRTASSNAVDLGTKRGWYLDFPDTGERNNINLTLSDSMLEVVTIVPSSTICAPGGYSWYNYIDYRTGSVLQDSPNQLVGQRFSTSVVGTNIFYLPNGKKIVTVVKSNDPNPEKPTYDLPGGDSMSGTTTKVIWRELAQ